MRLFVFLFCLLAAPGFVSAQEEEKETESETEGPIIEYLEFTPKFTVNLAESRKYLMINVQILAEGAAVVETIRKNMPALRHELIMLFSGRASDQLQTMEQREALRQEAIVSIREALDKLESSDGFKDVFFTEFLID